MSKIELNPHILPSSKNVSPEKHHKSVVTGVVAAVLAVIIGFAFYLWGMPKQQNVAVVENPQPSQDSITRSQLISQLQNSDVPAPTAEQKKKLISTLSKSKATITTAQKEDLINRLRQQ